MDIKKRREYRKTLIDRGLAAAAVAAMTDVELIRAVNRPEAPAPEAPAPEAPAPAPAVDAGGIAAAIQAAIAAALAGVKPAAAAIDEAAVVALIEKHSRPVLTVEIRERGETRKIEGAHPLLARLVTIAGAGLHSYLYGPAGSGKSTLARQCADSLGRGFYMSSKLMTEFSLLGFVDAHGDYKETAFYRAWTTGGVFLLDEMDACSPAALAALNDALASGRCTFPAAPEEVPAHEDFVCIGAGNTVGRGADRRYTARTVLDAATLDRFCFLEVGYCPDVERRAAEGAFIAGGGDAEGLPAVNAFVDEVQRLRAGAERAGADAGLLITPRASIAGASLLAAGLDSAAVLDALVWRGASEDVRRQVGAAA